MAIYMVGGKGDCKAGSRQPARQDPQSQERTALCIQRSLYEELELSRYVSGDTTLQP